REEHQVRSGGCGCVAGIEEGATGRGPKGETMSRRLPAHAAIAEAATVILTMLVFYGLPIYIVLRIVLAARKRSEDEARRLRLEVSRIGHELECIRKAQNELSQPKPQE